jgi:hypothetical protein
MSMKTKITRMKNISRSRLLSMCNLHKYYANHLSYLHPTPFCLSNIPTYYHSVSNKRRFHEASYYDDRAFTYIELFE